MSDDAFSALLRRHDALVEILRQIAQGDRLTTTLPMAQVAYRQVCALARAALDLDGKS